MAWIVFHRAREYAYQSGEEAKEMEDQLTHGIMFLPILLLVVVLLLLSRVY